MNTEEIIKAIDAQIAKLQQVRELIASSPTAVPEVPAAPRRGRPKGSTNKTTTATKTASKTASGKAAKRVMSAEGKARIAAAQKLRWAKQKNAATPAKSATKKSAKKAAAKPPAAKKSAAKNTAAPEA